MRAALVIAGKDLRVRIRDRSVFMMAILLPFGLALILNATLSDVAGGSVDFAFAYADEDRGPIARTLRTEVLAGVEAQELATVTDVASEEEARALVARDEANAALVVPAGFSAGVQSGRGARLRVIGDVEGPLSAAVARAIAEGFGAELDAVRITVVTVAPPHPAEAAALAQRAAAAPDPVRLEDETASRRELDITSYFAAGLAVFFLFFTVQFGVSSLLEERKEGTLQRLLAAPVHRASVLGGKLLTSFVLGVGSMSALIVATSVLLGARWGDPLGVGVLVVAGVLSATAVMALVATLARTSEQAGSWQAIIALVLGMLGGSFFPVGQAGGLLERLSFLTPHAWFLRGLGDLAGGASAAAVLPAAAAIVAFAAATGSLALVRLPRMARP